MPDEPRTARERGLLRIMSGRSGIQREDIPEPVSSVMDRQHEDENTPYAQRRRELRLAMLASLRITEDDPKPLRLADSKDPFSMPEEADEVRDEEEI